MRTPEEVAREAWQAVADSIHRDDQSAVDAMAEVIAARDAEVLAGFEWVYETSFEDTGTCMSREHTEHDGTEYVTSKCYFPSASPTKRRLVGPWEPMPEEKNLG